MGSKSQNSTDSELGRINLKGMMHAAKIFSPQTPPPTFGVASKGQNLTFSEQGHVAYQIKWNGA